MKKLICAALVAAMALCVFGCAPKVHVENSTASSGDYTSYKWPSSELAGKIPQFDGKEIKIDEDSADELTFWVKPVDASSFDAYVNKCKDAGFTEDSVTVMSTTYTGYNSEGYGVTLVNDSDEKALMITIYAPSNDETETNSASSDSSSGNASGKQPDDKDFVFKN